MGFINVRKVWGMSDGYATYEIKLNGSIKTIKLHFDSPISHFESDLEEQIIDVVADYALEHNLKIGLTIDPFKAAEPILSEHYGYAKMVEANYEWRPRVRY